jgi:hypothetical protein
MWPGDDVDASLALADLLQRLLREAGGGQGRDAGGDGGELQNSHGVLRSVQWKASAL